MSELSPCPFCGSAAVLCDRQRHPEAWVLCTGCDATGRACGEDAYAIEAWNDREPSPSEARLREMLCRVQDVIRYAANSEGGLAAEIDLFLGDGIERRAKA